MRVECPSCTTSYEIEDSAIGPKGRKLRCGKCSGVWNIAPPEPEPEPEPEPVRAAPQPEPVGDAEFEAFETEFSETEPEADDNDPMATAFDELNNDAENEDLSPDSADMESDVETESESEPDEDDEVSEPTPGILTGVDADFFASEGIRKVSDGETSAPMDLGADGREKESLATIEANVASALAEANEVRSIESVAARKRKSVKISRGRFAKGGKLRKTLGGASLAASLVLVAMVIMLRAPIVRAVPDLASLYSAVGLKVNLRGLAFRDIRMLREVSGSGPVFVVEGLIENVSGRTVRLPDVLFSLRDDAESELFSWTTHLSLTALPAGEVTRFKTELTTAPAIATDILVRFSDSPQRRAGL